jgi:hypothetical protein
LVQQLAGLRVPVQLLAVQQEHSAVICMIRQETNPGVIRMGTMIVITTATIDMIDTVATKPEVEAKENLHHVLGSDGGFLRSCDETNVVYYLSS